jgi:hypothetical protein
MEESEWDAFRCCYFVNRFLINALISQLDLSVKNEEVLRGVKEEGNVLRTIKGRKAKWVGHILRRNCRLKHVIEER